MLVLCYDYEIEKPVVAVVYIVKRCHSVDSHCSVGG